MASNASDNTGSTQNGSSSPAEQVNGAMAENMAGAMPGDMAAQGASAGSWGMMAALAGVAALAGILIALAYELTLPIIKANKARALRQSVFEVLPNATQVATFKLLPDGSVAPVTGEDEKSVKFYAGYDAQGKFRGVAIEAQGQGFQDVIKVLYGYDPQTQQVVGMRVLESKETPGLGDKIGNDPQFLANFADLDVRLADDARALLHPLQVVKKGAREEKWQIDAITGATISSKAIGKMMNESTRTRLPQVIHNLKRLGEKP